MKEEDQEGEKDDPLVGLAVVDTDALFLSWGLEIGVASVRPLGEIQQPRTSCRRRRQPTRKEEPEEPEREEDGEKIRMQWQIIQLEAFVAGRRELER